MAKILFGAQKRDLWFLQDDIADEFKEADHEMVFESDALTVLRLLEANAFDVAIFYGGPLNNWSQLGNSPDMGSGCMAAGVVSKIAKARGSIVLVVIMRTFFEVPAGAADLVVSARLLPSELLVEVEKLLAARNQ